MKSSVQSYTPGGAAVTDSIFTGLVYAPVFRPSAEEFTDPLEYARKIRPLAEPFGLCKIIPPANWKPQFALNDSVKFKVKQQHLGRLLPVSRSNSSPVSPSDDGGSGGVVSPKSEAMESDESSPVPKKTNGRKRVSSASSHSSSPVYSSRRKTSSNGSRSSVKSCVKCKGSGHQDKLQQCRLCQRLYHEFCVPLTSKKFSRDWLCRDCQLGTGVSYGYGDGGSVTLTQYKELAEQTKKYFGELLGISLDSADLASLEEQYWKILNMEDCDIQVMYGSDVDTGKTGTGFPTSGDYRESGWNVNNFPYSPNSLLQHIGRKISGVMRPWLYFGMMFSTFAWHIEDHHLYSVNYMHQGAPKKWYGIRGKDSEAFESAMRAHIPDAFDREPDLHYQLVTMVPPNVFLNKGIPVCTLIQNPGEFVFTFPGAYHGGFNLGFNCAESTNFAVEDWLPYGLIAMENYRMYRMKPVFSYEYLIAVLLDSDLDSNIMEWMTEVLGLLIESETYWRYDAFSANIKSFNHLEEKDEVRDCVICNHMCHLSWVSCKCSPNRFSCAQHHAELCECDAVEKEVSFVLTLKQMDQKLQEIRGKVCNF
eukprot:TRINITY_DN2229_c0_g1_i1.p1 TRINITY_DN2229_c0_g1~~TRINITY_DN2229_c0_g1_i1.p1  ORF type:complete len:590 (+),score=100.43 TRINITY_DN2229_c0_g1_i1:251-2020(+)